MSENVYFCAGAPFEAARRLADTHPDPRLRGVHGHGFQARLRWSQARAGGEGLGDFAGGQVDALRMRLERALAPLDYRLLNDHLAEPTDENLARWIRAHAAPGVDCVGVQSTRAQGVDLDADDIAHAWRRYRFEAAHCLPRVAPGHKCGRMHGHGFAVLLHAEAPAGAPAFDAAVLDRFWAPLHAQLHHACLNEIAGLENPTSENIAQWIWQRLRPQLSALRWVTVYETATCGAHYDGAQYRIWKEFGFDSAVRLGAAPAGDARARVHGHSYRLRLHLSAPLDTVLGWTIDFGDVKEIFAPVYARLDHHPLHELPGVAEGGSLAVVRWLRAQAAADLPGLARVDLEETPGCGVVLAWGDARPELPL